MARLTEEMVIARSRVSDLTAIKKLNCWGGELADVSILRRMLNLEVLSISVNKIASLSDLQYCKSLRELYVRNNEIRTLNEVCYLQELPALKILWLGENPCAKEDVYRLSVLKALPKLEKLDDVIVQPEEREDAVRKGRVLLHPESEEALTITAVQRPRTLRPSQQPPATPILEPDEPYEDERYRPSPTARTPPVRRSSEIINERITPKATHEADYQTDEDRYETTRVGRKSSEIQHESGGNLTNGSENGSSLCDKCYSPLSGSGNDQEAECEWMTPPQTTNTPPQTQTQTNHHTNNTNSSPIINENGVDPTSPPVKSRYLEHERRGSSSSSNGSGLSRSRNGSPPYRRTTDHDEDNYRYPNSSSINHVHSPPRRLNKIEPSNHHYSERLDWVGIDYVNGSLGEPQRRPISEIEPKKSTTTKANLLTAVICLIMELDYEGLVHVEKMVRRRRDEITEQYQPS